MSNPLKYFKGVFFILFGINTSYILTYVTIRSFYSIKSNLSHPNVPLHLTQYPLFGVLIHNKHEKKTSYYQWIVLFLGLLDAVYIFTKRANVGSRGPWFPAQEFSLEELIIAMIKANFNLTIDLFASFKTRVTHNYFSAA